MARRYLGAAPTESHELTDGWFNAAFALSLPTGEEYVLKVAPAPGVRLLRYERDLMRAEVEAMRLCRGLVPVPEIVAWEQSPETLGSPLFLMRRLPGVAMNRLRETLDDEAQAVVDRQIGQVIKAVGSIRGTGFGLWNGPFFGTWREAFGYLMESLEADAVDLDVLLPTEAFKLGEPFLAGLDDVREPVLVHWDMWDGNVFVEPSSLEVTGVIDFERALWGDPLMEGNFLYAQPGFFDGYGCDLRAGAEGRRFLYDLYLMLVMVVESKFRGFTSEHEAWPRGELDKLLARAGEARSLGAS